MRAASSHTFVAPASFEEEGLTRVDASQLKSIEEGLFHFVERLGMLGVLIPEQRAMGRACF